ncbi:MAG: hypothetical protein R3D63_08760 [Paracoccaceae bacterium]
MFRKTLAIAGLAALLSSAAHADAAKFAKVDVTTDLAAIQNAAAAKYWGNLDADLEAAISARLGERLMTEEEVQAATQGKDGAEAIAGPEILIDIREVELSNTFERVLNLSDAVLVGQVNVNDQTNQTNYDAYELSVSLETAKVVLKEGETLMLTTGDTGETYRHLVDSFADYVVENLK